MSRFRRVALLTMQSLLLLFPSLRICDATEFDTAKLDADKFNTAKQANWHQWRGPNANGVAPLANPPVTWSETDSIAWKVPIDGLGRSTPIVWGDRVFLLTAIDTGEVDPGRAPPSEQPERPFGITYPNTVHEFVVLCLNRKSGQEVWRRTAARKVPHQGHHGDNDFASSSPTTDGQRLYVWFGSVGLFCFDLDGNEIWRRDLGEVNTRLSFGEGSSPALHNDRLVLVRDHEDQSTVTAFDTASGRTVWQVDRDEPSAWATPLIVTRNGITQVITNATNRVRSYDLHDGRLIWECGGQVSNVTPCPVATKEMVFCMSGHRGSALFALPIAAHGDITDTQEIRWSLSRGTPYVPSPLLYDGWLYFNQSNSAILSVFDAESGEPIIERTRLPSIERIYASPVAAAGRIYIVGRDGTTLVIERADELKILATNEIDEGIDASPAVVGRQIFLRARSHLYCISDNP